jgi:DNA-directed RNA polymerase sigma subunit (sigma70/sigma32)
MPNGKRNHGNWNPDLGLAILAATTKPPHDYREIAAYMGLSWQRVHQIEQRALRKLRLRLYQHKDLEKEFKDHQKPT